jgi:hypothetical protein
MELDFKTTVVKRGEGDDVRYVPNLPDIPYGLVLVFCNNQNFYAYPLPPETEGLDCLAHVVYHAKDDAVMQAHPGKLGKGNEVTKLEEYKSLVVTTVADQKIAEEKARLTKEAEAKGEVVSKENLDKVDYKEADAEDGIALWVFNTKEYLDK